MKKLTPLEEQRLIDRGLASAITPPKKGEHWRCEDEPPCCECEGSHCCHDCPVSLEFPPLDMQAPFGKMGNVV